MKERIHFLRTLLCGMALCLAAIFPCQAQSPVPGAASRSLRLVSMTPNVTEMIVALGAETMLVGISDFCKQPAGRELPRCGGLLNPNFEKIVILRPDRIFLLGQMEESRRLAQARGIRTVSVQIDSFAELRKEMLQLGELLGKRKEAGEFDRGLQERLESIRNRSRRLPHYRVLVLIGHEPGTLKRMMSVNGHSFVSEMLDAAGGINVFAGQKLPYFTASRESILASDPEVIFDIYPGRNLDASQLEKIRAQWISEFKVKATERGRVVIATEEFLTMPGPRMPEIAAFFESYLSRFAKEDRR